MVAQSVYRLTVGRGRQRNRFKTASAALSTDSNVFIKMCLYIRYKEAKKYVHQILLRTRTITANMFNMNRFSDEMALHAFRFLLADLKK